MYIFLSRSHNHKDYWFLKKIKLVCTFFFTMLILILFGIMAYTYLMHKKDDFWNFQSERGNSELQKSFSRPLPYFIHTLIYWYNVLYMKDWFSQMNILPCMAALLINYLLLKKKFQLSLFINLRALQIIHNEYIKIMKQLVHLIVLLFILLVVLLGTIHNSIIHSASCYSSTTQPDLE